jgi:predicted metal-dependent peptidase
MASIMEKARNTVVLDHPFFASIVLRHPMVESESIQTISIAVNGQMTYNPVWFETLTVKQATFVLCHEVLHYASMHGLRRGARDKEAWNEACDAWNNDTLKEMKIGEPVDGCVQMPGAAAKTVDTLYDEIMLRKKKKGDGQSKGQPGAGQGKGQGKGDPLGGDLEAPGEGMTQSQMAAQEAETKMEVAEAGQAAKMRGTMHGLLEKFVAATIDSKVPWYDVLERFMTEKVMQDYSWSRPNRRYMPQAYLPTLQGIGAMGEIVIQVDISGSVSRKEIEYYNGHLKRIVELCNPQKTHVIYTDTRVCHHDEFATGDGEEMEIVFHSGGGTDMRAVFPYLEKKGIDPVCVVTLTDGYTPFPDHTDYPAIWCISSEVSSPTGETIHFSMHDK